VEEVKDIRLEFEWDLVLAEDSIPYLFPQPISKYLKSKYTGPAVYRWSVISDNQMQMVYYGEAENLARRIGNYQRGHKSQQTAARIHHLLNGLNSDLRVVLERLRFESFSLNGVVVDESSLTKKEVRCLLENALMATLPNGVELLNKATSVKDKQVKKALGIFEELTPANRDSVLAQLKYQMEGSRKK
jgi:hypothetical protein